MYRQFRMLTLSAVLPVLGAVAAHADTITDTITSVNTPYGVIVLTVPASPTPSAFTADSFTLNGVKIVVDGDTTSQDIVFYDALAGGGGSGAGTVAKGDVLFTGSTSMPTFKLGTFAVGGYSVAIAGPSVSPVPEPSSLLLMGTGVLGVCGAIKRRLRSV